MKKIISKNPANKYDILGEINVSTTQEIKEKVNLANKIKNHWKELDINKKIELLKPIYLEFIKRKRELSKLISKEIGKTAYESFREVEISLNQFEWYLNNVKSSIKDEITYEDDDSIHKIVYEPFGSVVVISPWNFPFGIAINGIIPNLLVGNVVLFKIAEECPLLGKFIETIFNNHSLPKSVFLVIFGGKVEGKILLKEKIDLICFTGSTKVGEEIYKIASNKFIKAILELGGSSPGIICDSADVSFAVKTIFKSRFYNSGQICDCVKRAIVHESIFNEFVLEMKNMLASKKQGNPLEQNIDFGSLVSNKQLKLLESQVN
ncbi:MAG: aldehyde dehydrogenase, partial [Nanoarchaeota archaeon]|nr:aldehyde dehydrogenase [Nanoarchaeota archaeon]